jgi:hypothetical protein
MSIAYGIALKAYWMFYFINDILNTFFTHTFLFFSGNRDVLRSSLLQKVFKKI